MSLDDLQRKRETTRIDYNEERPRLAAMPIEAGPTDHRHRVGRDRKTLDKAGKDWE